MTDLESCTIPEEVPFSMSPRSVSSVSSNETELRKRESHLVSDLSIKLFVEHEYRDYAKHPQLDIDELRSSSSKKKYKPPFPVLLHTILTQAEVNGFEGIISWQPHGRSFLIRNESAVGEVIHRYFGRIQMASFFRQLNVYGFKRLYQKTDDRFSYYHERFLRGRYDLSFTIKRTAVNGNKTRRFSDPDNEPNFKSMDPVGSCPSTSESLLAQLTEIRPLKREPTRPLKVVFQHVIEHVQMKHQYDIEPFPLEENGSIETRLNLSDPDVVGILRKLGSDPLL